MSLGHICTRTFFIHCKTDQLIPVPVIPSRSEDIFADTAGYREHKLSEFDDCLDPGLALIVDWMQISGNNGFSLDMLCAVLDSLARDDICAVLRNVSSEWGRHDGRVSAGR